MSLGTIISIIKDVVILSVSALLVVLLVSYGKDVTKIADIKAVQTQLSDNARTELNWRQRADNANDSMLQEVRDLRARIDAQRQPVLVCKPATSSRAVPAVPTTAANQPSGSRGNDAGTGADSGGAIRDIRGQINDFELRYETLFAQCRALRDQWPRSALR